jgi:hypothetical protein
MIFCDGPSDPVNGPHVNATTEQKQEAMLEARERANAWAQPFSFVGKFIADQAIAEIDACEGAVITIDAEGIWTASTDYKPLAGKDTWKIDGVEAPIFYSKTREWPPNTTAIVNSDVGDRINHKIKVILICVVVVCVAIYMLRK